jgi:alginate lyase
MIDAPRTYWPLLAGLLVCAWTVESDAQSITLTPAGLNRLRALAAEHRDAAANVASRRKAAVKALGHEPHPVGQLRSEGLLSSDPDKRATHEALADMPRMADLAWAAAIDDDEKLAAHARATILAWCETTEPTGNPIDATSLEPLLAAYDLTRRGFSAAERSRVDAWLKSIAERQIAERKPKSASGFNNWNSHRLKIVGLIGFLLDDAGLAQYAVEGFRAQIEADLEADGSSFDFHERDALHYHVYTLEPLLTLAIAADKNGIRGLYAYVAPKGSSLKKSVAWLEPFATGEQTHAEYVQSRVESDRRRAKAGQQGFKIGAAFEPEKARDVYELASYFEPRYRALACKLAGRRESEFATWPLLLNAAARP